MTSSEHCYLFPVSIRLLIDSGEPGCDSLRVLFGERLFARSVDGFRVGAPVFNDANLELFSLKEFNIGRGSYLMPYKRTWFREPEGDSTTIHYFL